MITSGCPIGDAVDRVAKGSVSVVLTEGEYQRYRIWKSEVLTLDENVDPTQVALSAEKMVGDENCDKIRKKDDALW